MKFEIKHRFSGAVMFEAELSASFETKSIYVQLGAAIKKAVSACADLKGAYLKGADLKGADLKGADLTGADLTGAYLKGADLTGAYLKGADLKGADLKGADLKGADLKGAYLKGADLTGAYLKGADLTGAYLKGAYLKGADLTGAYLKGADLTGAYLKGADLTGAYLKGADLTGAIMDEIKDADGNAIKRATPEESIANLDKVREIIVDDSKRLYMGHWHDDSGWRDRTCAEEAVCGTTHCLAGWLQVCSTDERVRKLDAHLAGIVSAPVAAKMFFRDDKETLEWLRERKYAEEAKDYA
jgi:uncharacterized protein YjbI with pentapeptide repeats